ncbi:anti-repressor SinI family protein [Oceanobacillus manasiensis]|uniref:anti-repressor SinI family protein n=1 Tax=Oceanobacillus manasiensis TaxID=586413 RepID=UPI000AEB347D|nr:anti-repressor SinI family protein [Oceanobacillus manasiensis]
MDKSSKQKLELDMEWVILMKEARELGLMPLEIRKYLKTTTVPGLDIEKKKVSLKKVE